jgi:hypothetical protein
LLLLPDDDPRRFGHTRCHGCASQLIGDLWLLDAGLADDESAVPDDAAVVATLDA